ncbi:hypothetical protein San01_10040 [Streptomyces angustmyceticus]|uniref:Uncharacterized protein n=1 Tax=Streptomyces angustmyceticus TaxID=285578 RepID=A0A5J4L2C7_9ACTN|nr:hypothetical protein San01_10040 [Streptomyces angustmyceticus]
MTPPAPADSGDRSGSLPTPAVRRESDRPAGRLTLNQPREHVAAGRAAIGSGRRAPAGDGGNTPQAPGDGRL